MGRTVDVAVVGATGTVGEVLLSILEERKFPVGKLYPLASDKSEGEVLLFKNRSHMVENVEHFDFSKVQLAFFSAGEMVSTNIVPRALEAGCIVIDNSASFRYEEDVPLVIPEVNAHRISEFRNRGLIANPNCSTVQILVALKPLYDALGMRRLNVATYQSVSGTGKAAIEELVMQTAAALNGQSIEMHAYPKQIAFNLFPHIDTFLDNGYSKEEMKIVWETHKILEDPLIQVNATTVRVPVFFGHSCALSIETERPVVIEHVKELLQSAPGITLFEEDYPTPFDVAGSDEVMVGRVRSDLFLQNGLNLWVVADNVRKGAALNAIQIAEILLEEYWNETSLRYSMG